MSSLISKPNTGHLYRLDDSFCKTGDVIIRPSEYLACQFGGYISGYCSSGFLYNNGYGGSYAGNWQAANQLKNTISTSEGSTTYTWQQGNYEPRFAMMCGSLGIGLNGDPVMCDGSWAMYPAKRFRLPDVIDHEKISKATLVIKGGSNFFRACNNCFNGVAYAYADWMANNSISGVQINASGDGPGWRRQSMIVHTYGSVGSYYPANSHFCKWKEWVNGRYIDDRGIERTGWHWEYHTEDLERWIDAGNNIDAECNPTIKAVNFLGVNQNYYHSIALSNGGSVGQFNHFGGSYGYYQYISGSGWYDSNDGVWWGYDLDSSDMSMLINGNLWITVAAANSLDGLFITNNNNPGFGGQQIVSIDDYKIRLELI